MERSAMFVLLLCAVGSTFAQSSLPIEHTHSCDGFGQGCSIQLAGNLKEKVTFRLSEPIICVNHTGFECAVVITIQNSHPQWIAVNPCAIRWTSQDWHQRKSVYVQTVQDYAHKNEKRQVHLDVKVISDSPLYSAFNPSDIYVESKKVGSAQCRATGDPHYTTFDGKYWHYYDGNRRFPTRVTLYRATDRDFVVQNQVRGNPAVACALAGREGKDVIIIDNCGGGLSITANIKSEKVEDQPVIDVSGNTYTVYFKSGAWMRASVSGWGMNVYTQSVDPESSCGLCGNFDGNPNNDVVAYRVNDYNSLYSCQKVDSSSGCDPTKMGDASPCDIWNYVAPTTTDDSDEDIPDIDPTCPYEPPFLKPLIGDQEDEEITEFLRKQTIDELNRKHRWDETLGKWVNNTEYPKDKAKEECQKKIDGSDMVKKCLAHFDPEFKEDVEEELIDCTDDFAEFGGPDTEDGQKQLTRTLAILEQRCIEKFVGDGKNCTDGDTECHELLDVLCPDECNKDKGQGKCHDAVCKCTSGFAGKACEIPESQPPTVNFISEQLCDTQDSDKCPKQISIEGSGFYCLGGECNENDATQKVQCRYRTLKDDGTVDTTADVTIMDAHYIGEGTIQCPVPQGTGHHVVLHKSGDQKVTTVVEASNNGKDWSTGKFEFTFYDSLCVLCEIKDGALSCPGNQETCQITKGDETMCYPQNSPDPAILPSTGTTNPCRKCLPSKSHTSFSYWLSGFECSPQFSERLVYEYIIVGKQDKGPLDFKVDARENFYVNTMPGYKITYKFKKTIVKDKDNAVAEDWFDVDENSGNIILLKDVSMESCGNNGHCFADPTVYNGFFRVEACDQENYCTEVAVNVNVVKDNGENIFGSQYDASIKENSEKGTVLSVTPNLQPNSTIYTSITYSIFGTPANLKDAFEISPTDAKITVKDSSKLDYEDADIPFCSRHRDNKTDCDTLSGVCSWDDSAPGASKCIMKPVKLTIQATTDTGVKFYTDISIIIYDVEEAPTGVKVDPSSFPEGSPSGTKVGKLTCLDPEYFRGETTECNFTIEGTSKFSIRVEDDISYLYTNEETFDFENEPSVTVSIQAEDVAGNKLAAAEVLTVQVTDANDIPFDVSIELVPQESSEGGLPTLTLPKVGSLNGNPPVFKLSEDTEVDEVLGTVSAKDQDPSNEGFECQLAESVAGDYLKIESNKLKLKKKLDFEANPNVVFKVACLDIPPSDSVDPHRQQSEAYEFKIEVQNAPEAPSKLTMVQSKPYPDENTLPASGKLLIGKIEAVDDDADAVDFTMEVEDPDTFEISNYACEANPDGPGKKCSGDLSSLKALDTAPTQSICSHVPGSSDDTISCFVSVKLTDGANSALTASETVSFKLNDKVDLPTGISCNLLSGDNLILKTPVAKDEVIGSCTVLDNDLNGGNDAGHKLTIVAPNDALVLAVRGRMRKQADDGTEVWELKVEKEAILNSLQTDALYEFELSATDLKNGGTITQNFELSILNTATDPVEDIVLSSNQVTVPFKAAANTDIGTLELSQKVTKASLVKKQDASVQACNVPVRTAGGNFYRSNGGTENFCTQPGSLDFEATLDADGKKVTVKTTAAIAAKLSSSETLYLDITTDDSREAFLKVEVNFNDACVGVQDCEQCFPCDIDNSGVAGTVDCSSLTSSPGFVCNVQGVDLLVTKCEDCVSDCSDECNAADDAIDDAIDNLEKKFDECTTIECKTTELTKTIKVLGQKEEICDKLASECTADEKADIKKKQDEVADEQDKVTQEAEKECQESNSCGELEELINIIKSECCESGECISCGTDFKNLAIRGEQTLNENETSESNKKSDSTGIIVAVVVVLLLVVIVVVALLVIRQKQAERRSEMTKRYEEEAIHSSTVGNQAFNSGEAQPFTPGVSNPLYDWYRPEMTRQECTTYLEGQGEGAFIVRDSQATPGWHMLCVKTQNQVLHDKIRLTDDGFYELLPTLPDGEDALQPKFKDLPDLIDHYVEQQPGMPYVLALANPIYDNHNLQANRDGYQAIAVNDPNAPSLSPKGVGLDGLSNPMYGAGQGDSQGTYAGVTASEGAYSEAAVTDPTYADSGDASTSVGAYGTTQTTQVQGYLDVSPDVPESSS